MTDIVDQLIEAHANIFGQAYDRSVFLSAKAEIERLRAALAPFSDIAQFVTETQRDSRPIIFGMDNVIAQRLTIGHLRAASAAISPAERDTMTDDAERDADEAQHNSE